MAQTRQLGIEPGLHFLESFTGRTFQFSNDDVDAESGFAFVFMFTKTLSAVSLLAGRGEPQVGEIEVPDGHASQREAS